jgi:hypothetical protein
MKDKDFYKLVEFSVVGGGLIPCNSNAFELMDQSFKGEVLTFKEITDRDLKMHRCYFSLLNFIYNYLPDKFKRKIPEHKFYLWLKHLAGEYDVLFEFKDGTKLVEYQSIAFGNMSQKRFKSYIKEQLPYIYENVLGAFFEGEILNGIIDTVEEEYKKLIAKL